MNDLTEAARKVNTNNTSSLEHAIERIQSYVSHHDLDVCVLNPRSANILFSLDISIQENMAQSLLTWVKTYEDSAVSIFDGSLDAKSLRRFCELMSYRIDESFYSTLRGGDCIEAYEFTPDYSGAIQSWRNWKFLELSSYDLASLMTLPMHELFKRDESVQKIINNLVMGLIADPKTKLSNIPPHVLTEIKEMNNRQFFIENKFVAPIWNGRDQVIGFMSSLHARPLGSAYADSNVTPLSI